MTDAVRHAAEDGSGEKSSRIKAVLLRCMKELAQIVALEGREIDVRDATETIHEKAEAGDADGSGIGGVLERKLDIGASSDEGTGAPSFVGTSSTEAADPVPGLPASALGGASNAESDRSMLAVVGHAVGCCGGDSGHGRHDRDLACASDCIKPSPLG